MKEFLFNLSSVALMFGAAFIIIWVIPQFLAWLLARLGYSKQQPVRIVSIEIGDDEPIERKAVKVQLSSPIKPGKRRKVFLNLDAPVDAREGGTFALATTTAGDSSITVRPESTAERIALYVNGDGSLGTKEAEVTVDAHVGEGDIPLTLTIGWEVRTPDATKFTFEEATPEEDEDIPQA